MYPVLEFSLSFSLSFSILFLILYENSDLASVPLKGVTSLRVKVDYLETENVL